MNHIERQAIKLKQMADNGSKLANDALWLMFAVYGEDALICPYCGEEVSWEVPSCCGERHYEETKVIGELTNDC